MKVSAIITACISLLLLMSQLICGLWLKGGNEGSVDFHAKLGIAAVAVSIICIILFFIVLRKLG